MPLFDRRCTECDDINNKHEVFEHIDKGMVTTCPKCGKVTFVKQFSAPHLGPDGLYSFFDQIDKEREKAAAGHGNISLKA
jgi:putative FmdB family regulatory protein